MPGFEIVGEEAMFAQQEPCLLEWVELRGGPMCRGHSDRPGQKKQEMPGRGHMPHRWWGNNMRSLIREEAL